ncbi:SLC13 family permease [Clostridioides sp. ES-S-0048-02]|uniref:SLC13 family permease n=1 Tax=Clostridioides sp. ES-S-0048-02 TaxID=2770777 RepID=UPI001D109624|nr:citrate transporter [Clostridioides sp. ES-S-0048-02]
MSTTAMSIIMLTIIIALILSKKMPMQFALSVVPIVFALIMGVSIIDLSTYIIDSANSVMKSSGYMLLFALMYFTMLSETGMFEILVNKIMKLLKCEANVWVVVIFTTIIALIASLTASTTTTFLIVFPIMIPLYNKINFDKKAALIITITAFSFMSFVPWGMAVTTPAAFSNLDPMEISKYALPIALCVIPAIVLQWIYFGLCHKKQVAMMVELDKMNLTDAESEVQKKENPNAREEKFWINIIVFVGAVVALAYYKVPAYLVFIITSFLTVLINYPTPKEYQPIWAKCSVPFYQALLMIISIAVFLGILNGTGMLVSISEFITSLFPEALTRYMYIILIAIAVIVLRFIPYQVYMSILPVLVAVGVSFGLNPAMIAALFAPNYSLAVGSSPLSSSTHVAMSLLDTDVDDYVKLAMPVQTVTNIIIIVVALIFGVIK